MQSSTTNLEIFHLASFDATDLERQTMTISTNPLIPNGIDLFGGKIYIGVSNSNATSRKVLGYFTLNSSTLAFSNYVSYTTGNYEMISTNLFVISADEIFADYQDPDNTNHGFIRFRPV